MNAPERLGLPDVQSQADAREIGIDAVGISDVRYPITVLSGRGPVPTVATLAMTVDLPAASKGTHMSRFIELLEMQIEPLDQASFRTMVFAMLQRLDARSGSIEMQFPYFVRKSAPVSGVPSLLDHDVRWCGSVSCGGAYSFRMRVAVPATSLCPCSKKISAYSAHNQRSRISIDVDLVATMAIEELIALAESSASCEVYGLLKRPDEKFVTEKAYDNPKFVEDLVRDVALRLNGEPSVLAYTVEAENFESIHNHSAFARVARPSPAPGTRRRPAGDGRSCQVLSTAITS